MTKFNKCIYWLITSITLTLLSSKKKEAEPGVYMFPTRLGLCRLQQ